MATEFLLLLLRNAIATKEGLIAQANLETQHRDGWTFDWAAAIRETDKEIDEIIDRIKTDAAR